MSLTPNQPETLGERRSLPGRALYLDNYLKQCSLLLALHVLSVPDIKYFVFVSRSGQAQCCCLRLIFFVPLAVCIFIFALIFTHGVAAGQMHRTVKNQRGELPFPKCQAYNLQNESVTKKERKEKRKRKENNVKEGW